jgi:hypothetical protein
MGKSLAPSDKQTTQGTIKHKYGVISLICGGQKKKKTYINREQARSCQELERLGVG